MTTPRTIAIGDIHGCSRALQALVELLDLQPDDTVITLGDYVGKGIDSNGVLNALVELQSRCRFVSLLGNHDKMMLAALNQKISLDVWNMFGGMHILKSYSGDAGNVPQSHIDFLQNCKLYFESDTHLFVHACFNPSLPLSETDETVLLWQKLDHELSPHASGKLGIVGHTSQKSGEVLVQKHIVCIDTNCWAGGWLTAYEVNRGTVLQVDREGVRRS